MIPAVYLFIHIKDIRPRHGKIREWTTVSAVIVIFLAFILYNLRFLPIIDFLPYKTGTFIPGKMIIHEGNPVDKYETTFIYEKEGRQKEFSLDNYPADDTTWKFVDQRSVLVAKGYQPPIHDLTLTTPDKEDITQQVLSSVNYTLLMISKKLEEADPEKLTEGFRLGKSITASGMDFYVLTASGTDEIENYSNEGIFCNVDETTLKTMVRSNPGYILLKEGTIMGKWSWASIPDEKLIKEYKNKL